MVQQMSMGMGVAVGAIALRVAALFTGRGSSAPTVAQFHIAFILVSILAAIAVLDCLPLHPHAGAEVSHHRPSDYDRASTVEVSQE
jgi:hypothetical protein